MSIDLMPEDPHFSLVRAVSVDVTQILTLLLHLEPRATSPLSHRIMKFWTAVLWIGALACIRADSSSDDSSDDGNCKLLDCLLFRLACFLTTSYYLAIYRLVFVAAAQSGFAGSYLTVQAGSGELRVLTLTDGGQLIGINSSSAARSFGDQQGSWEASDGDSANGVLINFSFNAGTGLSFQTVRNEIEMDFSGNCQDISGTFNLFIYADSVATADPLNPGTFTAGPLVGDFTGRKINVI